jgi:hypothetical protein
LQAQATASGKILHGHTLNHYHHTRYEDDGFPVNSQDSDAPLEYKNQAARLIAD